MKELHPIALGIINKFTEETFDGFVSDFGLAVSFRVLGRGVFDLDAISLTNSFPQLIDHSASTIVDKLFYQAFGAK